MSTVKPIKITDLEAFVKDYETLRTQKWVMTRELAGLIEFHTQIESSWNNRKKGTYYCWYLGNTYDHIDVQIAQTNISIVLVFRKSLDKLTNPLT